MRARFESKYFQMEYAGSKNHSQRTSICQNLFYFSNFEMVKHNFANLNLVEILGKLEMICQEKFEIKPFTRNTSFPLNSISKSNTDCYLYVSTCTYYITL